MKKIIYLFAVISALFISSCSNDAEVIFITDPTEPEELSVSISVRSDGSTSTTSLAETYEKAINTLSLFAFNEYGTFVIRRDLTTEEITNGTATFALPKSAAGKTYSFFAVANRTISSTDIENLSDMEGIIESDIADYNGAFTEVTGGAKRNGGFVMTGLASKEIGTTTTTTPISIELKRIVAKVFVSVSIDEKFYTLYSNPTLTFNSATISKSASTTSLKSVSTPVTGNMTFSHTQNTYNSNPIYIFYIYENGALSSGDRVFLEIDTTLDPDGSPSTFNDHTVTYSVELSGDNNGAITRNGFYQVDATIYGVEGQGCSLSITASDWDTATVQMPDFGE